MDGPQSSCAAQSPADGGGGRDVDGGDSDDESSAPSAVGSRDDGSVAALEAALLLQLHQQGKFSAADVDLTAMSFTDDRSSPDSDDA